MCPLSNLLCQSPDSAQARNSASTAPNKPTHSAFGDCSQCCYCAIQMLISTLLNRDFCCRHPNQRLICPSFVWAWSETKSVTNYCNWAGGWLTANYLILAFSAVPGLLMALFCTVKRRVAKFAVRNCSGGPNSDSDLDAFIHPSAVAKHCLVLDWE